MAGHLFQSRYKAILYDKDTYLLSLLKYIHLNPVMAGMVKHVEEYRWTSHKAYATGHQEKALIDADNVSGIFSRSKGNARKLYQAFIHDEELMEKGKLEEEIDELIRTLKETEKQ